MSYIQKGKQWYENQQELRQREAILAKRATEHEQIHEEKENIERQKRLSELEGNISDEDKRLLESREARLKAQSEANRAKWSKFYSSASQTFNSLLGDSHTTKRSRRKRVSY